MGKKNIYTCPLKHQTVTEDIDEGVTPFMIGCLECEAKGIDNMATSSFYRVDQSLEATHEWYRPTEADIEKMADEMPGNVYDATLEHIKMGGLKLRKKATT